MGNLLHTVSLSNCGSSMSILKTLGRWHVRMFCLGDVKMWYRLQFERRTAWRNKTHSENPAGPASGERTLQASGWTTVCIPRGGAKKCLVSLSFDACRIK